MHTMAIVILTLLASRHRTRDLDVKRGLVHPSPLHFRGKGNSSHTGLLLSKKEVWQAGNVMEMFFPGALQPCGNTSMSTAKRKAKDCQYAMHDSKSLASQPAKRSSNQVDTDRDTSPASIEEATHLPTARMTFQLVIRNTARFSGRGRGACQTPRLISPNERRGVFAKCISAFGGASSYRALLT